jgi:NAD(P)-dependent dehydrogenase (short-subunit alcohol dehydrogenase family)
MRLDGKVAVITGGASGIGLATAKLFLAEGARVAIVDRAPAELPGALALQADVTAEPDLAPILAAYGRVDILVTAAGFSSGGTATTIAPADFEAVMRVHVWGTWLWARAVIPVMAGQGGGSIVTVSSQLARAGGRNNIAYISAKGAILSMTRTMALDHVGQGIRVNAILPGAIETPLLRRSFARAPDPALPETASLARHPMHRFGRPEEIAEAALYFASDAAAFTTGTELAVDGGWLAG